MLAEGAYAQPSVPQFLQTTSIFTSNTSESCVGSHRTHKKVWQKSLKFLNQEGEDENLTVAELNLRIVVNKVKLPCINKHSTGRIREGLEGFAFIGLDRGAQCAHEDWHAVHQATCKGIEGEELENCTTSMYNCTRRSTLKSRATATRQRLCGC